MTNSDLHALLLRVADEAAKQGIEYGFLFGEGVGALCGVVSCWLARDIITRLRDRRAAKVEAVAA